MLQGVRKREFCTVLFLLLSYINDVVPLSKCTTCIVVKIVKREWLQIVCLLFIATSERYKHPWLETSNSNACASP